jgi:hypothetical protein
MPRSISVVVAISVLAAGLVGCSHDTWNYRVVPDTQLARPNPLDTRGALILQEGQTVSKPTAPAGRQTVIMASWKHESSFYDQSVGRTLVIFLDGKPRPGQYWLTADNAVLLTYSAYSAPARERVNLSGSIRIEKVEGDGVVADIAVLDSTEIDSSNYLDRPWDPVNQQFPFRLRGTHKFAVTTTSDPVFEKAAVKWVTQ